MRHDTTFDIFTAPRRNSKTWKAGQVTWGEIISWVESPADHRECGSYVLGTFEGDRRRKSTVRTRGVIALDADYAEPGFLLELEAELPWAVIAHTTWRSTPESPRYRVLVPVDRPLAPDEYDTAARAVMQRLGERYFDPQSPQPERYMFKPSAQSSDRYEYLVQDGPAAPAEELLASFDADLSEIPLPRPSRHKRDPYTLEGTVGAFNRAYTDWDHLITAYSLPYEPAGADRWHLVGASGAAGMGVSGPGLVYSHHSHDPAYGVACSAFDLVRLHLHGHLDEDLPDTVPVNRRASHEAMLKTASEDTAVVRELIGDDFISEMDTLGDEVTAEHADAQEDWRLRFRLNPKTGRPTDEIFNWDLITENDPSFTALYYNEMTLAIEVDRDLPWRGVTEDTRTFTRADRATQALHVERVYGMRPSRAYLEDVVIARAMQDTRNPVRDYLETLVWDGQARLEYCLPGVEDSPHTRLVARKSLVAAVGRMMDPGCKWDHMLVIYGLEGLGKTHWINRMSRGYASSLGRIGDKDTLITMQRSWIMVSDEGHSMKKADFDTQKEFLTRTSDVFRMPYDREAMLHKRHSVVWGTTNDQTFLRRQEGNRRFLIVESSRAVDFDALTDTYVDQVWAEAVYYYRAGERLYLTDQEAALAADSREAFTEEDTLAGAVQEYLDTPVPARWPDMTVLDRVVWLESRDPLEPGEVYQDEVCSRQVWTEALGNRYRAPSRMELLEISQALDSLPEWESLPGRRRVPGYGPQRVYRRIWDEDLL